MVTVCADSSELVFTKPQTFACSASLAADRVLEEYRRIAFADIRKFFDAKGNLIPIQDLGEDEASCLAGLELIVKNAKAGDGHTDEVHKFKLWDKTRALEALAKHFGLLRERLEVSGWDKLAAQLNHASTVGPTASTLTLSSPPGATKTSVALRPHLPSTLNGRKLVPCASPSICWDRTAAITSLLRPDAASPRHIVAV
jgi:Terminase small subunit